MTHAEMDDLYELYVLGTLEPEQASEIDEHVQTECVYCLEHLQDAVVVTSAMSGLAELQRPPANLRKRVIASVKPETRSRSWIFAVASLSAACLALALFGIWSSSTMRSYQEQITDLQFQRNELRSAVEILSKSETKTVQFGLAANKPHGRVFVNSTRGLVFVGSELPALAANKTFQLWLIPATGAPESAGLFRPNAAGNYVAVQRTPIDTARIHAVAVSVEPPQGSAAPTTTPVLIVPLA